MQGHRRASHSEGRRFGRSSARPYRCHTTQMVNPRGRYIWVLDRQETPLPFSKFVAASSIMVIGIEPEMAYAIAEETESTLFVRTSSEIPVEDLMEITIAAIDRHAPAGASARYRAWVAARRQGKPIIVLLGGAPGVGKSSVAGAVGSRLRIPSVIPTDAVREVMRQLLPDTLAPMLHVSSFDAHRTLRTPVPADHDAVVVGFQQQAETVAAGVRGLVERAITEGTGLIVEGVHMVPGLFDAELETWQSEAVICQGVLAVKDRDSHRSHFLARAEQAGNRSADRYLDAFSEVRRIDRYIRSVAEDRGVPVILMEQLDDTIRRVMERIVDQVIAHHDSD